MFPSVLCLISLSMLCYSVDWKIIENGGKCPQPKVIYKRKRKTLIYNKENHKQTNDQLSKWLQINLWLFS